MSNTIAGNETLIEQALKKYNVTDKSLQELEEKCLGIKVFDVDDKKGYAAARTTRSEVRCIRVQVEGTRKQLKADSLLFGRAVDKEASRITNILTSLEVHLSNQEKIVDDEKERIKTEKAEKLKQKAKSRVDVLISNGMVFNGLDSYKFLNLEINTSDVCAWEDERFHTFINELEQCYKEEILRSQLKREEEEKRMIQQREEAEKLRKISEKQEAERKKLEAEKHVLEQEKLAIEQEKQKKIMTERMKKEAELQAERDMEDKLKREKEVQLQQEEEEKLRKLLLSDHEKLKEIAVYLDGIVLPQLEHKESSELLSEAMIHINKACNILRKGELN